VTRPGPIVTERDLDLLRSLADYRWLTSQQLQRLHFPSAPTTLRRLRRLEAAGVLLRRRSDEFSNQFLSLTRMGMTKLTGNLPAEGRLARGRLAHLPGNHFLKHFVEVNDFRIALELSARGRPDVSVLGVLADTDRSAAGPAQQPRGELTDVVAFEGQEGERLSHTPDLAFALRRGERQALFLVEIDRGSEVVGDPRRGVGRFVRFYLRALVIGAFSALGARLGGPAGFRGFRVLVVTASRSRLEAIRARWGSMPTASEVAKRFIWLSTRDALRGNSPLEHEWMSLDPRDSSRYSCGAAP